LSEMFRLSGCRSKRKRQRQSICHVECGRDISCVVAALVSTAGTNK
jgi:hypothetical protein